MAARALPVTRGRGGGLMGYFASLARQSGVRVGGHTAARPAPVRGIDVEETRIVEAGPQPLSPALAELPRRIEAERARETQATAPSPSLVAELEPYAREDS